MMDYFQMKKLIMAKLICNKSEINIGRLKNLVLEKKLSLSLGVSVSIGFGAMSWPNSVPLTTN